MNTIACDRCKNPTSNCESLSLCLDDQKIDLCFNCVQFLPAEMRNQLNDQFPEIKHAIARQLITPSHRKQSMNVSISHSWAISAAVCSARRLQSFTTTEWNIAQAEREAQSLVALNAIGPGLPRHYRTMRIGGRKIGDGIRKVSTITAAKLIAELADSVL